MTILIVGGGVAGITAARELLRIMRCRSLPLRPSDIALVEPKEYFEVPFAQLRALVHPRGFGRTIRKPIDDLIPGITRFRSGATGLVRNDTGTTVRLASGEEVSGTWLVLATGSRPRWELLKGAEPDIAARQSQFERFGDTIAAARSVLVIGGGPIGVELSGEILSAYPGKQLTLVHAGNLLLPGLHPRSSARATRILAGLGALIHTSTSVRQSPGSEWTSPAGRRYSADLVIRAVGIDLCTRWLSGVVPLDENGRVPVDRCLRVPGMPRVLAVGDINNLPGPRRGERARSQGRYCARVLAQLVRDPERRIAPYRPGLPVSFVTIGPHAGITETGGVRPHFLIGLKQKDLFVKRLIG